jgi:ankyrin repeat protein
LWLARRAHPVRGKGRTHLETTRIYESSFSRAAAYLASRGARLDLEGAAGVGRADLVASFFNENGSLKGKATQEQMRSGFRWACEYGHKNVVTLLIERGIAINEQDRETGLHWAAFGA